VTKVTPRCWSVERWHNLNAAQRPVWAGAGRMVEGKNLRSEQSR